MGVDTVNSTLEHSSETIGCCNQPANGMKRSPFSSKFLKSEQSFWTTPEFWDKQSAIQCSKLHGALMSFSL